MAGKRRVLITGAAGHLGRVLAHAWRHDHDLVLTDLRPLHDMAGTRVIQADLRQVGSERDLCAGMDTIVHLAISGNLGDPPARLSPVNLEATRRLLTAASAAGCRRFVFASSLSIALYPETAYARAKLEIETWARALAENSTLSIHCLRLGWVLAPNARALWPGGRNLDYVLTHSDMVRLFTASIDAPAAVHFGVFDGISDNGGDSRLADLEPARRELCYHPRDNAHALARRNARSPLGIARRLCGWIWHAWS